MDPCDPTYKTDYPDGPVKIYKLVPLNYDETQEAEEYQTESEYCSSASSSDEEKSQEDGQGSPVWGGPFNGLGFDSASERYQNPYQNYVAIPRARHDSAIGTVAAAVHPHITLGPGTDTYSTRIQHTATVESEPRRQFCSTGPDSTLYTTHTHCSSNSRSSTVYPTLLSGPRIISEKRSAGEGPSLRYDENWSGTGASASAATGSSGGQVSVPRGIYSRVAVLHDNRVDCIPGSESGDGGSGNYVLRSDRRRNRDTGAIAEHGDDGVGNPNGMEDEQKELDLRLLEEMPPDIRQVFKPILSRPKRSIRR